MNDPLANLLQAAGGNGGNGGDDLDALFAGGFGPMPAGWYVAELVSGKLGRSKNGKQRYELRVRIIEGDLAGRSVPDDFYLTPEALWKTGPILKALGIATAEQVRRDLPAGLLARVRLVVEDFNGTPRNKIGELVVTGRKPAEPASPAPAAPSTPPAAPAAGNDPPPSPAAGQAEGGRQPAAGRGDAWEHPADRRLSADGLTFSFGANDDTPEGPYGAGGGRR